MLARKPDSKNGKSIPQDWLESFARLLEDTYRSQCETNHRFFDVYGQIYDKELLIVVSWLSEDDQYSAPITCFLSCEPHHMNDEVKVKNTQQDFMDIVGLFFDEIFASDEWHEFEPNWQEVTYKHENYFFKISRENVNLTLEANKLLGDDFVDVEEMDDDEDETRH